MDSTMEYFIETAKKQKWYLKLLLFLLLYLFCYYKLLPIYSILCLRPVFLKWANL